MKLDALLQERSGNKCELSGETGKLNIYEVNPDATSNPDRIILISEKMFSAN